MKSPDEESHALQEPADKSLYHFLVPREEVDLLHLSPNELDFGFSGEELNTLIDYLLLQRDFEQIDKTTIDMRITQTLPYEQIQSALVPFLSQSIRFKDIDLPTTIKSLVLDESMNVQIMDRLQEKHVEIWVDEAVLHELSQMGISLPNGLQIVDFGSYAPVQQRGLVSILSEQFHQALEIIMASRLYPEGVSSFVDLGRFMTLHPEHRNNERISFSHLYDLKEQYRYAKMVLDNPLLVPLGEQLQHGTSRTGSRVTRPRDEIRSNQSTKSSNYPETDIDQRWEMRDDEDIDEYCHRLDKQVEELRSSYEGKTLYEHLGAATDSEESEVYCAFWRVAKLHGGYIPVDFGDESFITNEIIMQPDGNIQLMIKNATDEDTTEDLTTAPITHYRTIVAIDKVIKSLEEELEIVKKARERLRNIFGNTHTFFIESNIIAAIRHVGRPSYEDQADEDDNHEQQSAFNQLLAYDLAMLKKLPLHFVKRPEIGSFFDMFSFISQSLTNQPRNMLRELFSSTNASIYFYKRLFPQKKELYAALNVPFGTSKQDIRSAYRRIVKELSPIRTAREGDFDPVVWETMRARLEESTRAYSILQQADDATEVMQLGSLSKIFENEE